MKKLLSYLLLSLVVVMLLLMVVSAGAQTTRIKLTQIEKANTVNGTKANQLPLSNGVGDLRYAQYTEINPVAIGYTPSLTGNPTANYAQFVKPANGDVWYIDNEGRGIRLYVAASAGDYDWLEIANNQIPNSITDSIYKYKYASIGGRLVWPTAELLVIDSVAQGMFIVAGDRKAKVALYDTNNQTWCTLEQGGGTTALIMQDGGVFSIQTAGSGTPQAPGTPIVEHFNVLGDSSIQFPQYPNTRTDAGTPTKLWGPDATGKMKNYAVSALPVTLPSNVAYRDSVNTFTLNQNNSYTSTSATPAQRYSGTWYTGGGTTNTKPHVLIEPAGATSTNWNVNGTGLGINAASGFAGNLLDLQLNGAIRFSVSNAGSLAIAGGASLNATLQQSSSSDFRWNNRSRIFSDLDGNIRLCNSSLTDFGRIQYGGTSNLFPAHKRNGTTIETVLADDSGFAAARSLYQRFGSGSPEGVVTAPVGTIYSNTTGSAGTTIYEKISGTGNTGWSAIAGGGGITGTISSGQIAVGSGTNAIGGSSALTYTGNKLQINPTYTSAASGDAGVLILGTTTGSGTVGHRVVGTSISPTAVAGANDQVLNGVEINAAFSNGVFTGVTNNIFAVREGGNNKFSVSSTGGTSTEQLYARGGATTVSYVAASGTSGTATRNYGGDLAFNMTFQAGGTPSISDYIEITFATPLPTGTKPIVTWKECSGTDLELIYKMYTSEIQKSNTKFRFYFQVAPPSTSRTLDVHVIGG